MAASLFFILISFLIFFGMIRGIMSDIIDYFLNTSARRKRRKGMSFLEWFLNSKYQNEIPHYHFKVYYAGMIIYAVLFVLVYLMNKLNFPNEFISSFCITVLCISIAFSIGYSIYFEGVYSFLVSRTNPNYDKSKFFIRGVDKKAYREKMKKIRIQQEKENKQNSID